MLFMQSISYNFTKGDDGTCATYTTEAACLAPSSPYSPGASKCYWTVSTQSTNGGYCAFVEPNNSLKIVLFIAIFSAMVTTPIAVISDWIIQNILSAPTEIVLDMKNLMHAANSETDKEDPAVNGLNVIPSQEGVIGRSNANNGRQSLAIMRRSSKQVNNPAKHLESNSKDHTNLIHRTNSLISKRHSNRHALIKQLAENDAQVLKQEVKAYFLSLDNAQDRNEFQCKFTVYDYMFQ
jgi:hypothetical protein